jgi:Curli production assembly/transport component CsgG
MNARKGIFALFVLTLLQSLCTAQEKPQIAVLQLKNENATDLEVSVLTHLIENYFVNTNRYTVLERQDIDKVRRERAAADRVVTTDTEAARLGKLLNVQDIIMGTLMFFQGRYFCAVRMIDVGTSSIEKSCTETCESNDEFAFAAKRIVEKISGAAVRYQCAVAAPDRPDSVPPVVEPPQRAQFHSAGLSSDDCDRFLKSGARLDIWAIRSHVSPLLAGCLGALPVASGHYLTHNYGLAAFFSLIKTISVLGITQTHGKGGEQRQWTAAYCVGLGATTLADVITSVNSAAAYDRSLDILSHGAAVTISNGSDDPGLNLTITF